ncbi:similar to glucose-6-phosphate/phosphate translocator [Chondrus crispus]|uniref:Similar to glucose-6-phosphate/phosphate translocator n=1 Tax=Chondrus crispus TaxID=2769 RepID=R7Q4B2_CHOCR|nr:similar to glucose-6-phosphate/phosphate translocator [Chondrus crispus]CDF32849.1 similar to glucose-6-phosphate/phosphate translocator [Chondrus crispus]|eukprot:XP_005712650.1 similar to glucose-6-phosphate/phosphate translocator [Chondrus crispus]
MAVKAVANSDQTVASDRTESSTTRGEPSTREVATVIAFNFFSSTGIVSANKLVYEAGFHFGATLTFIHFICTTIGLLLLARFGVFTPKRLDVRKALKLAIAGMGFVVFSNLSLQRNSVGFYQVMKHMTVVGVIIIEAIVFRRFLPWRFLGALATMCCGVIITGMTDFKLNTLGTMFALANILCTSFYQIWCGSLQKSLEANPLQLQLYIAPLSALSIIPIVPMFDDYRSSSPESIFNFVPTVNNVSAILFTGALALCVNVSIFLVIGKTSAVTYNVVGNGKTAFLFVVDFLVFGRPFEPTNVFGMTLTLCGVIWYTQLKLKARAEAERSGSS